MTPEEYKEKLEALKNIESVPQRSPFRYPGGKTWLVPIVRKWLAGGVKLLVEPFCGGGIIGITSAAENLADHIIMVEKDEDVAAVWEVILSDDEWLANQILSFQMSINNVNKVVLNEPSDIKERALRTIIKNRTFYGGILAKGASMIKQGEKGKGLNSRWYPHTIAQRIKDVAVNKNKISFICGNAFDYLSSKEYGNDTYFFIDPPYHVAGKRLYTLSDVNHEKLFDCVSRLKSHYLLTYDKSDYTLSLAKKHNLEWRTVPMQTTHHVQKEELLISDNFDWL